MNVKTDFTVSDQIALMMERHGVKTRDQLRLKLGVAKNTIRNWELSGRIPDRFLRMPRPVQLIAALAVLRDPNLIDGDARAAALSFLEQLEAGHG
ncbi:MAG: helix-turn-helix domain containing protein [Tabrizicola sp.]|jgi:hypothetical protein|nr:helix-turn-helix domain containing protein [Tabrizicola sp.]